MRILILGYPGSGKGTQSQFLTEKYKIPKISSGDILRNYIKQIKNERNKRSEMLMNSGKLIEDEIIIDLIVKRVRLKDCSKGFILDGFPRNIFQAKSMKRLGIAIDHVIEIKVPEKIIFDRILGRRVHPISGRIYHIQFNPPKEKEKDDVTGESLILREDDKEEIIKRRLTESRNQIKHLSCFFQSESKKNRSVQYHRIDGTKSILEIQRNLIQIFK